MALRHLQRIRRVPRHAIWEITALCNMRCIHCESSSGNRREQELTTAEALKLCDDLADAGCEQCNVSGGEPLLREDWAELCRRLADRGIRVTLVTNGSLFSPTIVRAARDAGVTCVALSVDGLRTTHDRIRIGGATRGSSFDTVLRAIDHVSAAGIPAAIISHVNQWNLHELEPMHELLAHKAIEHWQVQLGLPLGRQRAIEEPYTLRVEQLAELAAILVRIIERDKPPRPRVTDTIGYYTEIEPILRGSPDKKARFWSGCYAGILTVGIDSDGNVKGCASMPPELIAGNIRERPFAEIWADEDRFSYNTRWSEESLQGYCAECAYRRVCRAGCSSMAWAVTGHIGENPYCLHHIAMKQGSGHE